VIQQPLADGRGRISGFISCHGKGGRDKRESEILGMLGLWQHVPPTANADELSFAHEAAYLLWMGCAVVQNPEVRDFTNALVCNRAATKGMCMNGREKGSEFRAH